MQGRETYICVITETKQSQVKIMGCQYLRTSQNFLTDVSGEAHDDIAFLPLVAFIILDIYSAYQQ